MKQWKLLALLVMAVLVIGGAHAQDVRYNFDKDANFSGFKTYKWVILKDAVQLDNIMDKNIKSAIDAELAKKGLTRVDTDNADLYVGYQGSVGQDKQFTSYSTGWGYGPGWGGGWYGPSSTMTTGQTSTIYTGQLVVDMYDSAHKDLVWRGIVSKTLDPKAKPEKQHKNLAKAMSKLFKNYPPAPKK